MSDRLITVFGGTGFLGSEIVRRILGAGGAVRVAARRPVAIDERETRGRVELCQCDIRNEDDVSRALEGTTGAVNAVSLYAERDGLTFDGIHVRGAGRVARRARENGMASLVHVSGLGADGSAKSPYVRARARGDAQVRGAFPDAVILRPSVIFGPGDAFLSAVRAVTAAPVVPLFGAGKTRLQPVHVRDVAEAARRGLGDGETAGLTFELGGPDVLTYREVLEMVLRHLGRRRLLVPVPFTAWHVLASVASRLPGAPLTRDQVWLLERDNVVGENATTFAELGMEPVSLGTSLEACLAR